MLHASTNHTNLSQKYSSSRHSERRGMTENCFENLGVESNALEVKRYE
jgi:hypothetical protein